MKTKKLPQAIAELKDYRERNGLTYQELADCMNQDPSYNMDPSRLSLWISGKVQPLETGLKQVELFLRKVYATDITNHFSKNVKYIDSRLVAQWSGMDHKELLKVIRNHIRNLEKNLNNSRGENLPFQQPQGLQSIFEPDLYFIKSSYSSSKNSVEYPCYLVTQRGCELLGHKMTGVKGNRFTALYINEFHRMKDNEQAKLIDHDRKQSPRLEDDPTFSREAVERRLANMTPEQRDLNYIRNKLIEVSKTDDIRAITPKLVRVAKLIDIILGTDSEAKKLQ